MKNGLSLRSKDFHVLIFIPRMLKIILKKKYLSTIGSIISCEIFNFLLQQNEFSQV